MTASTSGNDAHEILLVEDNRADIVLIEKAFEEESSVRRIHVATDGDEAMAILRQREPHQDVPRPSLILLDLNLPGMDGREVLAEVKSDDSLRRIPVIVLTSSQSDDDVTHCYDLHANAFMTKAPNYRELVKLTRMISRYWLISVQLPPF